MKEEEELYQRVGDTLIITWKQNDYAMVGGPNAFYVYYSSESKYDASITFRGRTGTYRELFSSFKNKKRQKFASVVERLLGESPY